MCWVPMIGDEQTEVRQWRGRTSRVGQPGPFPRDAGEPFAQRWLVVSPGDPSPFAVGSLSEGLENLFGELRTVPFGAGR
jgi:hypothetical protein